MKIEDTETCYKLSPCKAQYVFCPVVYDRVSITCPPTHAECVRMGWHILKYL